jgi:hypothetical protein
MSLDIPGGSQFPDLQKAGLNLNLESIVKGLTDKDQEFFELAQKKKVALNKQREIDMKSFWESQTGAIERGNQNACDTKNLIDRVRINQGDKVIPIVLPSTKKRSPYGNGKNQTRLPKPRSASPSSGSKSPPSSMINLRLNQSVPPVVSAKSHVVDVIAPETYSDKAIRNLRQFGKAQAGERGTSLGDRAVVFTANGTPMYGDSYLDRNHAENLAANQATSNLPVTQIPKKIQANKPMSAAGLQQQPRANVAPKSDGVGNMLLLGGIAAAVTAVLFLFQYVLIFIQMILQISSVTSTITNIAGSFVAILNNIGSLFGLGEGVIEPLSKTADSILNNTFGKTKVDYVKYQFAKVSAAYVAGQNLLNKVSGLNNTIGTVTADNANNTSKIGNALKSMGMLANGDGWMREDNKISTGTGNLGDKLTNISGLASSLTDITNDVKTATEAQKTLDKEQAEKEKTTKKGEQKATEKHVDSEIPDLHVLGGAP